MAQNGTKKTAKLNKLSWILIIAGIMLALYPLFTDYYARYQQDRLKLAMEENPAVELPGDMDSGDDGSQGDTEEQPLKEMPEGAFMIIDIPKLELSAVVLKGTDTKSLAKGPGWYEESVLPGEGNTAIAGHRTMHGAWFRHLDELKEGDEIIVTYQGVEYVYGVERVFVIAKNDWSVIDDCGYPALTLTTCHPVGSARQRLAVRARLGVR